MLLGTQAVMDSLSKSLQYKDTSQIRGWASEDAQFSSLNHTVFYYLSNYLPSVISPPHPSIFLSSQLPNLEYQ